MFKDMSKIMTWYIWLVTYLCKYVTIVCGTSYHLLGSQIAWDSKIRFWLQVKSNISDWQLNELQHLASHSLWQKMMPQHHGWGWYPLWTASYIHIRHIKSVWDIAYTITLAKLPPDLGIQVHLRSGNDATTSSLRLTSISNNFIHPY